MGQQRRNCKLGVVQYRHADSDEYHSIEVLLSFMKVDRRLICGNVGLLFFN